MFPLMFSQALFMASSSHKFSKAANLFVISIWYCFLTSSSFSFLRLNLSPSNLCAACLITAYLFLNFSTTKQWSVSQSALLNLRTSSKIECHFLSINMWPFRLWVFLSEVQVYLWMFRCRNIVLLTRHFDVAKFTILTPSSLLSWCRLLFPIVGFKIFSIPSFALKSPNRIFIWYYRKWSKTCSNSS